MIECYDEATYSYWSMMLGMICFAPIFLICVGGGLASVIMWVINKIRGRKKDE